MIRKFWLQGLSVLALLFAVFHMVKAYQTAPKVDPPMPPAASPYSQALAGSGMVEPETENIAIGSDVPGVVADVRVKVGQTVKENEELFTLDGRQANADVAVREANLRAARVALDRLEKQRKEEIPVAEAKVREAEAMVREADDMLARGRALVGTAALPREEFVNRERAATVTRAQLARTKAELALLRSDAWQAELEAARVAVVQAQAQLDAAKTDRDRLVVRAREPGKVLQVNVRRGEFVGAPPGQALIVLGQTDRLHVRVDINEYDIPRFDPALPASASFRGKTGERFPLEFVRVEPYVIPKKSLTGSNTERVDTRVLQVIYRLASARSTGGLPPGPPSPGAYVGQQLDVFFDAKPASSVGSGPIR